MQKQYLNPDWMFSHPQFTSIISVTNPRTFHFFAGRCPADENYDVVHQDNMLGQLKYTMEALTRQLEDVGATWSDVVHRRIYTTDMDECLRAQNDESITRFFDPEALPGSTLLEISRLSNPEFLVEIEIIAVTGQ